MTSVVSASKSLEVSFNPHTHEGCDYNTEFKFLLFLSFNPHTHEGCDSVRVNDGKVFDGVSIHTPTKGVTIVVVNLNPILPFQSTHPRRV